MKPERRKTRIGRNDPCSSGQPVKFKKCLAAHRELNERSSPADVWWVCSRWQAAVPPLAERLAVMPSRPTTALAKLDQILEEALKVGEDMEWNDLFHRLRAAGHRDLPGVFRRIAVAVPHTKKAGLAFFYWAAAKTFDLEQPELLGEVAANFRRLDGKSYDADALKHLNEILLAAGKAQDALDLLWHFWPILRRDRGLMNWVVPETADAIIELRIGLLRANPAHALDPTDSLVELVSDGLGSDRAMVAASVGIMWGRCEEPSWTKSDFEFPRPRRRSRERWDEGDADRVDSPMKDQRKKSQFPELEVEPLWLAARFAAAESFQQKRDGAITALYDAEMILWALSEWLHISEDGPWNLADILPSPRLENLIAGTCRDIMGPDLHRCLLLIRGLRITGEFLRKRGYLSAREWKRAQTELARLEDPAHRMRDRG